VRAAALALALGFLWANRAGCCRLARHTPHSVRAPLPAPPAGKAPAPALRALHIADFGDDTCQQRAVARGIAAAHERAPFDLVLSAGDNVYECGPDVRLPGAAACEFASDGAAAAPGYAPPADPRFALFEAPLAPLRRGGEPVPVWLALGNHDQNSGRRCREGELPPERLGRVRACLEVAHRGPHWRMPARHYAVEAGPARFVVLDTNLLVGDYGGLSADGEVEFFREATRGCAARPCFVVGHHPPATAGAAPPPVFLERLRRLEAAAGGPIAAWLVGHDHDLQHLRAPAGTDVFISGNGSRWRDERFARTVPPEASLLFASTSWGFAVLEVSASHWAVRFESEAGEALHCCLAALPGPCLPVACGPLPRGPAEPPSGSAPPR
jgi:hypothetical protein